MTTSDMSNSPNFQANSKIKKVRFKEQVDELGDHADSQAKPRKSRKIQLENHFDDCGADDQPISEADSFVESFLSFSMDDHDEHNFQENRTCPYFVHNFEDTFRILNYFQDHKHEQLDALQLFGGQGNIIKLGFRRG